jgi:hypothetical protein
MIVAISAVRGPSRQRCMFFPPRSKTPSRHAPRCRESCIGVRLWALTGLLRACSLFPLAMAAAVVRGVFPSVRQLSTSGSGAQLVHAISRKAKNFEKAAVTCCFLLHTLPIPRGSGLGRTVRHTPYTLCIAKRSDGSALCMCTGRPFSLSR